MLEVYFNETIPYGKHLIWRKFYNTCIDKGIDVQQELDDKFDCEIYDSKYTDFILRFNTRDDYFQFILVNS